MTCRVILSIYSCSKLIINERNKNKPKEERTMETRNFVDSDVIVNLLIGYNDIVKADSLSDLDLKDIKKTLIDKALERIGNSLCFFDKEFVDSVLTKLSEQNSVIDKYKNSIYEFIKFEEPLQNMTNGTNTDTYTAREFAQMLGVNEVTIQRKIANGEIKAVKFGRAWRIDKRELELMKIGFVRMTPEELSELCKSDTKDSRLFFKNYINTLSKIYDAGIELYTKGKNCVLYEKDGPTPFEIEECGLPTLYANDFCYYIDIMLQQTLLEGKIYKEPNKKVIEESEEQE